jgi:hypothetical protein
MNESLERQSVALLDPVVSVGWLADEVRQAMAAIGIEEFVHHQIATRIAPMGAVERRVAAAVYFNFSPDAYKFTASRRSGRSHRLTRCSPPPRRSTRRWPRVGGRAGRRAGGPDAARGDGRRRRNGGRAGPSRQASPSCPGGLSWRARVGLRIRDMGE